MKTRIAPLLAALAASPALAQSFNFSDGIQGWRVYSINFLGDFTANRQPQGVLPALDPAFGLPAPSLRVIDLAGETWIGPPDSVYGPRPELFGQSLSFDILYRLTDAATYASVGIQNNLISLWIPETTPSLGTWLHRDYPFTPGAWHVGNINGPLASEAQIRAVLADLRGVYIHTEWKTGEDDTSVDNVSIGAAAPACPADFNNDGFLDFFDIDAFLEAFEAGDPAADFNHDDFLDFFDADAFTAAFEAGC